MHTRPGFLTEAFPSRPARARVAGADTDFYVVTSESRLGPQYLSALVAEPTDAHIAYSAAWQRQFGHFAQSVRNCVIVGLADAITRESVAAHLNTIDRRLEITEYVSPTNSDMRAIRESALETLQTAIALRHSPPDPVRGTFGADKLAAFYAWL